MKSNKTACQFALYKGENDVYHSYYQNSNGTFCRVTTDVKGNKTWINYYTVSEVGTQIYNAALLGYKMVDIKQLSPSKPLAEYIRENALRGDNDDC